MSLVREELSNSNKLQTKRIKKGKVFIVRESLHISLMSNETNRSLYYIFVAIFLMVLLDNISHDLLTNGRITLSLNTMMEGFGKLHIVLAVLGLLHFPILGLYYALEAWNYVLQKNKQNAVFQKFWNTFCIMGMLGFQIGFLYTGTAICLALELPFGSAAVLTVEILRLMMKAHAFIRTNVPKLLAEHSKPDFNMTHITSMSSYFYYMFAPTFIYQNSYPRTERIRWKFATMCLLEMISAIFLASFLCEGYILPSFKNFDKNDFTIADLSSKCFTLMLPATLIFLSNNYLVLHCWLNFTGEVMRFGDRLYYSDWWTSPDFRTYYRKLNLSVHEWFHEFVYKDCYSHFCKDSGVIASLVVFCLSTFMHEYVLVLAMRMFFPMLTFFNLFFGITFYFTSHKLPPTVGNVVFWSGLFLGLGSMFCFYSAAYFSRKFSF